MCKFVALNCLNSSKVETFPGDAIQKLRHAVLFPPFFRPNIQQALQQANFTYHRTCSYSNLIQDCDVTEGETLLMFWGCERSESRFTVMSTSSASSVHAPASGQSNGRDRDLQSTAQQTDISCRHSHGILTPPNQCEVEEQRAALAFTANPVPFSSPASSLLQPPRSMSILSSVCALLLKQGSSLPGDGGLAKEASSVSGSGQWQPMCRICFGGESAARLLRPCACRGSVAAVHRACLERWLLQAASSHCELCRHHYVVTRTHKWSWLRSAAEWARAGRGRALLGDAWRAALLGAGSVLGTARALHACDAVLQAGARHGPGAALAANIFSSVLIGIIGALNGLLTTWMLLKIQEHQAAWRAWRAAALRVRVALPGDASRASLGARSSATLVPPSPAAPTPAPTQRTADRGTDPYVPHAPLGPAYLSLDPSLPRVPDTVSS